MKEIVLGTMKFATQKAAKKEIQRRLHEAELDKPLADFDFYMDLLKMNPEADEKIGHGVVSFKVRRTRYGNRCFYATHWDGTPVDFSGEKSLRPSTPKELFTKALRHAVEDQVMACREGAFNGSQTIVCPLSGKSVMREQAHVDHEAPWKFKTLAQKFTADEKINLKNPPITPFEDGLGSRLSDPALEVGWKLFHKKHAKLRVISKEAHQKLER